MDLPRYHRLRKSLYHMEGTACSACGKKQFPAARRCVCGSRDLSPYRFHGRGKLYSYSEIFIAPEGFNGPYPIGLVELEEGVKVLAQLTDTCTEDLRIGMPVEMVVRKITESGHDGVILYGYKFRPM